jgi:hypothetical protein
MSTRRLCHITAAPSDTSPSSSRLKRFKRYPDKPVISALGIRVVLDMRPPRVDAIGMKAPTAPACDSNRVLMTRPVNVPIPVVAGRSGSVGGRHLAIEC